MDVTKDQARKILADFQRNLYVVGKNGEESRPSELILVGSFRRGHETAEDIDLLALVRRIQPGMSIILKPASKFAVHRYSGKNRHVMLKVREVHPRVSQGGPKCGPSDPPRGRSPHRRISRDPAELGPSSRQRRISRGETIPVDIFITLPEEKPFALYHYTGSKQYNIRTRKKAKDAGYRLNQYGLFINNRRSPGLKSERDIARRIGVRYRSPTDRET